MAECWRGHEAFVEACFVYYDVAHTVPSRLLCGQVWPEDLKDGKQEGYGVESVCDVAGRVGRLVRSLEVSFMSNISCPLAVARCTLTVQKNSATVP